MNNLNVATAREVALNVLTKVLQQKSYSNIQLNFSLNNSTLDERDKALVTQLVYGTIQYKLFLEYQIKHLLRAKPKESFVVPLLLMSVYQLQFLDKIPDHAVLNSANELAKKNARVTARINWLTGFYVMCNVKVHFYRRWAKPRSTYPSRKVCPSG